MPGRLEGRVAVVTGAANGCGFAAARLFAQEGARVGMVDLTGSRGEAAAAELASEGHRVIFAPADVSDATQVEAAVATTLDRFGPTTALMNHAGVLAAGPFLETDEAEWDRVMAINVKGMFLITRAVLPQMLASGGGSIVCTSSISGVVATPMEVLYCTSKGACHMFARAIAVEFRDRGIRSNAVCPGFIATDHGKREIEVLSRYGVDVSEAAMRAAQGRLCRPEEVVAAALFLLSDEASSVNGAHLFADNGFAAI